MLNYSNSLSYNNPINILNRGYSILSKENETITSINQISIRDKVEITLKDGRLADIAPTILDLLDLKKPEEMNGDSLIK